MMGYQNPPRWMIRFRVQLKVGKEKKEKDKYALGILDQLISGTLYTWEVIVLY